MSPTDAPKNPLWDMFEYFLGQQIIQSCAMCDPKLSLDDDALAEMLPVLMDNLSCGRTQKEMYRIVAPSFDPPQRYAVFAELCSWMFATEGVMSKLYRPLLSQYATETTDDSVDGATGRKYSARLLSIYTTDRIRLNRCQSKRAHPIHHTTVRASPSAERATRHHP